MGAPFTEVTFLFVSEVPQRGWRGLDGDLNPKASGLQDQALTRGWREGERLSLLPQHQATMLPPKRRRRVLSNILPPGGGVTLRPPVRHANGSDARPVPGQPLRGSAGSDTKLALHHVGGGVYSLRPPCSEEAPRERERESHTCPTRCPSHPGSGARRVRKAPTVDISALVDTTWRRPKASNGVPVKTPQPSQTRGPEGGPVRGALTRGTANRTKGWFHPTAPQVVGYAAPGGREGRGAAWPAVRLRPGGPRGAADLALAGGSSSASGEGGAAYQAGRTVATPYDGKNCFPRGQPGRPNPA